MTTIKLPEDFTQRSYLALTLACLALLTPLGISNLQNGDSTSGIGAFAIIGILAFNAASVLWRGRYYPSVTLLALVPAIIFAIYGATRSHGVVGLLWSTPAILSFYVILPERKAWVANGVFLFAIIPATMDLPEPDAFPRVVATLLMSSAIAATFLRVILRQQRSLEELAVTDSVTGVYNRTLMELFLTDAQHRHSRTGSPMTLVNLDCDNFKAINDTHGHAAGDEVLRQVGSLLRNRLRSTDRIFRLGGEEFLVLLHDADAIQAERIAWGIAAEIRHTQMIPDRVVTFSMGIAGLEYGETIDEWVSRSDKKMYSAKMEGRDRVVA